jgi:hypothetical protein
MRQIDNASEMRHVGAASAAKCGIAAEAAPTVGLGEVGCVWVGDVFSEAADCDA